MITLYTIDCPKCIVLEKKLNACGIDYVKNNDINKIMEISNLTNILTVPILCVDDSYYDFKQAVEFTNEIKR